MAAAGDFGATLSTCTPLVLLTVALEIVAPNNDSLSFLLLLLSLRRSPEPL